MDTQDTAYCMLYIILYITRKLKYRVRECLDQLLLGGYTVREEGARAGRRKLVSYWIQMKEIKLISFRYVELKIKVKQKVQTV